MGTTGQSVTLANSIIGVGILAMPFCFQQCGVLLATLILLSMGLVSRLCCYFLLKSALLARRRNFEFLAFHVFGSAGKLAVEVGIIGFLMGTCIAYFVVVGDLGPQIIAKLFNINQSDILRTSIMVLVSLLCVLPLGLLRNVDSLSNVSAATIGFYFCLVMKVIAEAASQLLSGDWHIRIEMWKPSGLLQCVPIFSMALFCQTQLFEIFESMPTLSLEKMNVVTKNAINICTGVYFTLGVFGYIAFNSQEISGNILMSLSPTMASDVIKLGFVMSVAFSFPLIIFPCRASLYSLLYKKVHSSHHDHIINHSIPESSFRCITVAIIAVTLFISLLIPNIELVLGLVGSTIGVLICLVFPAACFVNVTFKNTNERILAKAIIVLGLIILVLGTYANLQAAESRMDKYDDKYITQEKIDKMVEDFFQKMDKSDDVIAKPIDNNDIQNDKIKSNDNEIKESVVQPPNPLPPESHSNEKPQNNLGAVKEIPKFDEVLPENKDFIDRVSESHPRNLNKLNGAKIPSDENNIEKSVLAKENSKEDKLKIISNEEKINLIKQQQLIETIKQHGEEQKELIKEQKEILSEIKKTKEELQQNKNEVDSVEAKKIAVESIKKIANMAIQSISGASDKPIEEAKKSEHIEKVADEAVKEIAKKAVETIEAIKDTEGKPDQSIVKANVQPVVSNGQNLQSNGVNYIQNNVNQNAQSNIQRVENGNNIIPDNPIVDKVVNSNVQNNPGPPIISQDNIIQSQLSNNAQPIVNMQPANIQPKVDQAIVNQQPNINPNVAQLVANNILSSNSQVLGNIKQINPAQNNEGKNNEGHNVIKEHSHSPDEPQSYQRGEDAQKNSELVRINNANEKLALPIQDNPQDNVLKNAPLPIQKNSQDNVIQNPPLSVQETSQQKTIENVPLPIQENLQYVIKNAPLPIQDKFHNPVKQNANANPKAPIQSIDSAINNNVKSNIDPVLIRQKREVVDCTEKSALKPGDKEICENLVDVPQSKSSNENFLPKVDINDLGLPKSLPLDANLIHHVGRSLKSYDIKDKER
ncbi:putative sodium-coupled neutral amino acid transporter 10 [Galleria mellonella]|uniref:Sodium-coupled neutral amino acid transporter 10 n=1 Tax=Galleria mellonella TaxID=7137 RepID=A0A6J1X0U3_GALME|nr:putative sodium-coupled neutral amino acid transporter 10 [Galleria mellonella]